MRTTLMAANGVAVVVSRYSASERQKRHTDHHSRISYVLRGGYREESGQSSILMTAGEVLLKSRKVEHEDAFGEDGAVLLALEFLDEDPFDTVSVPRLWHKRADAFALRHTTAFLEAALAGDACTISAAGYDLLSSTVKEAAWHRSAPPPWLKRLRCELEENGLAAVNVGARARTMGTHPAHASRLFRRCFGVSITEHAQAQSVRRAIAHLDSEASLREAAIAAGFYDQSHMNRVFRRMTGRTPGAYRALATRATG